MATKLLLDTCAFVWLAQGNLRLSNSARREIALADDLAASAVSAWELAYTQRYGNLVLPVDAEEFYRMVTERYSIKTIPLDGDIAITAAQLQLFHKDPADRFIIATALLNGYRVVTADSKFGKYGVATIC